MFIKLRKYRKSIWSSLACTAQILYPRISNSAVTVRDHNKSRSMMIKEYGYNSEQSATPDYESQNSEISILLNKARYARNGPQCVRDEVNEFLSNHEYSRSFLY